MRTTAWPLAAVVVCAANACGGDSGTPAIVGPVAVATVEVSPSQQSVTAGHTVTLSATTRDASGAVLASRAVGWSSSAPAVASVSPAGVVSALSGGSAVITATSEGKSGTAAIVVPPVVVTLFIDSIQPRLWVGRTVQLTFQVRDPAGFPVAGRAPQWSSSAPTIVAISSAGILTGVAAGSANITGVVDGQSATRAVFAVAIPPAVVSLQPETATLPRGADYALSARVADIDGNALPGHSVTFQSADASVATVSAQGVVRPIANGSVAIVATVDGKEQATSRITVVDPRVVSGVVMTADGARPANLEFIARFGLTASAQRFVVAVDSTTGAFTLVLPQFTSNGPVIEYFVDAASGTTRPYHVIAAW